MSIISKYLTEEIFKYFAIILVTVICIFLAVDFFEKIDNFIEAGLPFSKTISFFQFRIPFIIAQIAPVCILLAVLIVFGLMNKNNEIIALKSSGVSVYFFLRPVLSIGLLFSVFLCCCFHRKLINDFFLCRFLQFAFWYVFPYEFHTI